MESESFRVRARFPRAGIRARIEKLNGFLYNKMNLSELVLTKLPSTSLTVPIKHDTALHPFHKLFNLL